MYEQVKVQWNDEGQSFQNFIQWSKGKAQELLCPITGHWEPQACWGITSIKYRLRDQVVD